MRLPPRGLSTSQHIFDIVPAVFGSFGFSKPPPFCSPVFGSVENTKFRPVLLSGPFSSPMLGMTFRILKNAMAARQIESVEISDFALS